MQAKVSLIGGAGFIGASVLARLLEEGHDVTVADTARRIARIEPLLRGATAIAIDEGPEADSRAALKGRDVVIHLAWSSGPAQSMAHMIADADANIIGGLSQFNQAADEGVGKIIFASSGGTVYGNAAALPIKESDPLSPVSAYGVSKAAVERYLDLIAFHRGPTGISLRLGNPYGPYQYVGTPIGVIANFIRRLRQGQPIEIYGDGDVVRDYLWIDDAADAFAAAVRADLETGAYNIGTGEGHSLNEIASLIEDAMGIKAARVHLEGRNFDASRIALDYSKFEAATGWRPRVALRDGLAKMLAATAPY